MNPGTPEIAICERCGKQIIPTGIWAMPLDGFCECIFYRMP